MHTTAPSAHRKPSLTKVNSDQDAKSPERNVSVDDMLFNKPKQSLFKTLSTPPAFENTKKLQTLKEGW